MPEIDVRFVLSLKTVERHLSCTYATLDMSPAWSSPTVGGAR